MTRGGWRTVVDWAQKIMRSLVFSSRGKSFRCLSWQFWDVSFRAPKASYSDSALGTVILVGTKSAEAEEFSISCRFEKVSIAFRSKEEKSAPSVEDSGALVSFRTGVLDSAHADGHSFLVARKVLNEKSFSCFLDGLDLEIWRGCSCSWRGILRLQVVFFPAFANIGAIKLLSFGWVCFTENCKC